MPLKPSHPITINLVREVRFERGNISVPTASSRQRYSKEAGKGKPEQEEDDEQERKLEQPVICNHRRERRPWSPCPPPVRPACLLSSTGTGLEWRLSCGHYWITNSCNWEGKSSIPSAAVSSAPLCGCSSICASSTLFTEDSGSGVAVACFSPTPRPVILSHDHTSSFESLGK